MLAGIHPTLQTLSQTETTYDLAMCFGDYPDLHSSKLGLLWRVVQILTYDVQVQTTNRGALSWMNAEALKERPSPWRRWTVHRPWALFCETRELIKTYVLYIHTMTSTSVSLAKISASPCCSSSLMAKSP